MLVVPTAADSGSLLSQRLATPTFPEGSTLRAIQDRGFIRIAVNPDFRGFCTPNSRTGQLEGIDVMIARRLAQGIFGGTMFEVRPRVDFVKADITSRLTLLQAGEVDATVAVLAITPERRKVADFTSAYYGTCLTVVARNDSGIKSVSDLKDAKVVVIAGTADAEYTHRYELAREVVEVRDHPTLAKTLVAGDVQAAIAAAVHVEAFSNEWREHATRLPIELESYQYAVAVRKGDHELRDFLDEQMVDVVRKGYVAIAAATRRR